MLTPTEITEEQQRIEHLQQRWMLGVNEPLNTAELPESWQSIIEGHPTDRRSLMALALASHYQSVLFLPVAPTTLTPHPTLPTLQQAVIPSQLRARFRRVLDSVQKQSEIEPNTVLRLLLQRGFTAHPADWLPSTRDEDLPRVYQPWCQWVASEVSSATHHDTDNLNEDNWDEWYPAERLSILKALRTNDAEAARGLIQTCALREPAEKRLKIIQTLSVNLSDEDVTFLQSLANDRSQKIIQQASQFLARLGKRFSNASKGDVEHSAKELAETFEIKKAGLLKKTRQVLPQKLKSKKQQAIRTEQLEGVPLYEFAEALDMNVEQLVSSWQFNNNRPQDNQHFVINAVNTLPDSALNTLVDNLLSSISSEKAELYLLKLLLPRLTQARRTLLISELLTKRRIKLAFHDCLAFLHEPLTEMPWKTLQTTLPWKSLLQFLTKEMTTQSYVNDYFIHLELMALGLLLPSDTAKQALHAVVDLGMLRADPATDSLKFNADLTASR